MNKFTLVCNHDTRIVRDAIRDDDLPYLTFDFEPLTNIGSKEKDDVVDIIGIVSSYGPLQDVELRNNAAGMKRELKLVDQDNSQVYFLTCETF